jgi:hypothetical protein
MAKIGQITVGSEWLLEGGKAVVLGSKVVKNTWENRGSRRFQVQTSDGAVTDFKYDKNAFYKTWAQHERDVILRQEALVKREAAEKKATALTTLLKNLTGIKPIIRTSYAGGLLVEFTAEQVDAVFDLHKQRQMLELQRIERSLSV